MIRYYITKLIVMLITYVTKCISLLTELVGLQRLMSIIFHFEIYFLFILLDIYWRFQVYS